MPESEWDLPTALCMVPELCRTATDCETLAGYCDTVVLSTLALVSTRRFDIQSLP